jgi:hypothetical protein
MRRYFTAVILFSVSFLSSAPIWAQRAVGAKALVLDDGSGNTLTITYPNIPPVLGNSTYMFAPGGGSSTPAGSANGQTLWWNNTSLQWIADNSLTNTGAAIGIGTSTPNYPLDIQQTFSLTSPSIASSAQVKIQPPGATNTRNIGISGVADASNANTISGQIEGVRGQASLGELGSSSQPVNIIAGTLGSAENNSTQTITESDGVTGQIVNYSTGTMTTANALKSAIFNQNTGTITNARALYVQSPVNAGTITNLYGLYMDQQPSGWPIFLSDGSVSGSHFSVSAAGAVGIGTSTPTATLQVVGSASIGGSPDASSTHISNIIQYSFTYSFPATAAQSASSVVVTLGGSPPTLADGVDDVLLEIPNAVMTAVTGTFSAWVSSANQVTLQFNNYSTSTQTPPASSTYHFTIITH